MPRNRRSAKESAIRGNSALGLDPLDVADQQRAEVDTRRQCRPPVLLDVEPSTALRQTRRTARLRATHSVADKMMPRSRRQLRLRNPKVLLPLMLPGCAYRHA